MLIFFIHGVATRDVKYAEPLKNSIKEEFKKVGAALPKFYSSFWGNALNDIDKMWSWIDCDLQNIQQENPNIDLNDCFRYRQFRESFLSEFVGDMFTYLNSNRGFEIRKSIAVQLTEFIEDNPNDPNLHIIAHSLGSVIFWDIFFSERFTENDPAFKIRSLIQNLSSKNREKQVYLKSIITMGSPILFFNTMLAVNPDRVKEFARRNQDYFLKWLNIIHSSDIISYPIKSSFCLNDSEKLKLKDIYIDTKNNFAAKAARTINQDLAAMALDAIESHTLYWDCPKTARSIFENLLDDKQARNFEKKYLQKSINLIQKVPGIAIDKLKIHINDEPITTLEFSDGSGKLFHVINVAKIHHVYIFNEKNLCLFSGYVGWIHTKGLQQTLELIENLFVERNYYQTKTTIYNLNQLRDVLFRCKYCGHVKSSREEFERAVLVSKLEDGYYVYYLDRTLGGRHLYITSSSKSENFESSYNSIVLSYFGAFLGREEIFNIVRQLDNS